MLLRVVDDDTGSPYKIVLDIFEETVIEQLRAGSQEFADWLKANLYYHLLSVLSSFSTVPLHL